MPAKRKAKPPERTPLDRAVDAAMDLAAGKGWRHVALADIAQASGMTLAELHAVAPSRGALLAAFVRRIDRASLAAPAEAEASVRDRLFELLMRRLDALKPYKAALGSIIKAAPLDPATSCALACNLSRSLGWIAEAAGLEATGLRGLLAIKALGVIHAATLRVWLADDGEHAKTMAALDRHLKRAEMLANSTPMWRRARPVAA